MSRYKTAASFNGSCLIVNVVVATLCAIGGAWWAAAANAAAGALSAGLLIYNVRRHREHRRTARDRDSAGTSYLSVARLGAGTPGEATGESSGLAVREGDFPFLAVKHALVKWEPGGNIAFSALTRDQTYGVIAAARCTANAHFYTSVGGRVAVTHFGSPTNHEAPHEGCSCGFYAMKPNVLAPYERVEPGQARLDVELYGKVIVHENGYRAEKQRILRATLNGKCWFCGDAAAALVLPKGFTVDNVYSLSLVSRCSTHFHKDDIKFPLATVADRLGVEVVWQ